MNAKKVFCFIIAGILALSSCACQKAPSEKTVSSKSSGTTNYTSSATVSGTGDIGEAVRVKNEEQFFSTDDSVEFTFNIDKTVPVCAMPVVRVSPDFLSEEDAKRVANVLFGEVDYYESEPVFSPHYSKDEIQERIRRWSPFTNAQAVQELYGQPMYEQSPIDNPHSPCQWNMQNSSVYVLTADELSEAAISDYSDEVSAQFSVNGIPYCFTATTRNKNDYKVNMISCYIYDGMCPRDLDERIFAASLCRTGEPSQGQLDIIKAEAEKYLSSFDLGQWQIDECYVKSKNYGSETEYLVCVNAVPILNGASALRRPQISSLRNQNGYAANYYLTDAQFVFSANGDLISFSLFSPLDIQGVLNENAKVININDLLDQAKEQLKLSDSYNYGLGPLLQIIQEELQCNVTISEIEYGLSRLRVPDNEDVYNYVPSILLKGSSEYVGKENGKTYYMSEQPEILLVINAVDGTIINETNE